MEASRSQDTACSQVPLYVHFFTHPPPPPPPPPPARAPASRHSSLEPDPQHCATKHNCERHESLANCGQRGSFVALAETILHSGRLCRALLRPRFRSLLTVCIGLRSPPLAVHRVFRCWRRSVRGRPWSQHRSSKCSKMRMVSDVRGCLRSCSNLSSSSLRNLSPTFRSCTLFLGQEGPNDPTRSAGPAAWHGRGP